MKIEPNAELVCNNCSVEGPHELLYLSDRMRASRCENCGAAQVFTRHLCVDYAVDVVERGVRLPLGLVDRALRNPLEVFGWPFKGVKKPFILLRELGRVVTLERVSRRESSSRYSRLGV